LERDHIEVEASDRDTWLLNFNSEGPGFAVGQVDGSAPIDLDDLYTKLRTAMGAV